MKLHKPLFSLIVIIIQLILSIVSYLDFVAWGKANSELDGLISRIFHGDSLFLFVLVIGLYEMQTKPSWFKTATRIFLVCIVLGTQFSGLIPIEGFYYGVYNTAWFSTIIAIILFLFKMEKNWIRKTTEQKQN